MDRSSLVLMALVAIIIPHTEQQEKRLYPSKEIVA